MNVTSPTKSSQAIDSQSKALFIWKSLDEKTRVGASLRLLSRFYWFKGMREEAEIYGLDAINELENESHLQELAKAYSNYAQLKMLSSEKGKSPEYGQKAIELANKIHDEEILCHALNNIGSAIFESEGKTPEQLYQSLEIALRNGYQEHVARAYYNLSSNAIEHKLYDDAEKNLELGIAYCGQRDLDSWTYYMLGLKARLHFEKCELAEAEAIARNIVENPEHPAVIRIGSLVILGRLLIRKGDFSGFSFLDEARHLALITKELQRIIPVTIGLLEYGWIMNDHDAATRQLVDIVLETLDRNFVSHFYSELAVWLLRNNYKTGHSMKISEPWSLIISGDWQKAARQFQLLGCPNTNMLLHFSKDRNIDVRP